MANLIKNSAFSFACLASGELLANESAEKVAELSHGITAGYFLKLGAALLIVLSVFFAFAWLLRRINHLPTGEAGLQIVSGLNVGAKEKLIVVQMGEEQILLGVTQQSIHTLHVLKHALPTSRQVHAGKPIFANLLNNVLGKGTSS